MPHPHSPPAWARRLADGLLVLTAVSLPLSISGTEVGVMALGALSIVSWILGWGVVRRTPLDGPLLALVLCFLCSTLMSLRPLEAVEWADYWNVMAYFVVYWWLPNVDGAARFVRNVAGAGALVALYGIVQHFTGIDWYREAMGRPRRVRPRHVGDDRFAVVGFFRNYLTFAHAMVAPYASSVALALGADTGWGIAAVLIATAILFSTARGAWLAVLAVTFAVVALDRGRRVGALALALTFAMSVAISQSPELQRGIGSIFALGGENAGRVAIYQVNLSVVEDHPWFGLGFGRYRRAAQPYYREVRAADRRSHAHNNFLQIAAEAGLVSLAAFAFLFATALRLGFEGIAGTTGPARAAIAGAWGAVVGFLVGGFTQYTFGDSEVVLPMWCMLAVLMRARPVSPT